VIEPANQNSSGENLFNTLPQPGLLPKEKENLSLLF